MSNEEIKYFNVKNTSIRLVHFGGVMVLPGKVKKIVDDPLNINRATVESDDFLEITDEDPTDDETEAEEKQPAKKVAKSSAKTPTGAGWNSKG